MKQSVSLGLFPALKILRFVAELDIKTWKIISRQGVDLLLAKTIYDIIRSKFEQDKVLEH